MSHILDAEIEAFEQKRNELLAHHAGKYVVFNKRQLTGIFDSFDEAANMAIRKLDGPYLIRQVGSSQSMPLPASVAFRPVYAAA